MEENRFYITAAIVLAALSSLSAGYAIYFSGNMKSDLLRAAFVADSALESVSEIRGEMDHVKIDTEKLGASLDIPTVAALFESSLASNISSSATSFTLTSATDKEGNALASSTYPFIIDEGTANEEMVLADCTGTACTNVVRGISVLTGTTTVSSLQKSHRRGASVKITDGPQLMILTRIINGIGTFPNVLSYKSGTACSVGSANSTICDKAYIDGVAVAGASNANETTKGIVEIATGLELASTTSTGGTAARLVLPASLATSSPWSGATSTIVITRHTGKISQAFFALTEHFSFSSLFATNASTTNATTTHQTFPSLVSTLLKTDSNGKVTSAVSGTDYRRPSYTYSSNSDVAANNGYATTSALNVPASVATASSTLEIIGNTRFAASGNPSTATIYLRRSTGATILSCTWSNTGLTQDGYFMIRMVADNSTSAQNVIFSGSSDVLGAGASGYYNNLNCEGTAAIDTTSAQSYVVTVQSGDASDTYTIYNYQMTFNP